MSWLFKVLYFSGHLGFRWN